MANYDLGTARGTIELAYRGDGPKQAKQDLDDLKTRSDRTAQAYTQVGGTFQKAGAAMGAGIAVAVKSAADFEQRMSAIKAVSGATGAEMEQLRNKALQLGKDTSFSASQSAQAIEELVKQGVSVPDVMNGAADATVALAEAGQLALPRAAEIASNAMNQFKLSAQDLPHVADLLAGAANASSASVEDLGSALQYVGPVAHSMGLSIDDTTTALAVLAQNGIKGTDAGTALRGVLLGLTPTTDKQTAAFKELGLITKDGTNLFYDAQGKLKPFDEIVQILHDHTKDLSAQEKATFYEGAFGRNAMTAATILGGETAASFDKMAESIGKVSAADVAAERLNNFKGSLEQLKGSLETFLITAGTPLLKVLKDIVDGLTGFVNKLLELPPGVINAGVQVAAFASGLLLAVGTIMKIIGAIARFKLALETLGIIAKVTSMASAFGPALAAIGTAATGPIGIIIAALVALGVAFYELYKHNEAFRNFVNGIATAIKDYIMVGVDRAKLALQALVEGFNGVTSATGILGFFQDIGAAARTFWDALKELWAVWQTTVWPILKDAGSQIWQALKQAWVDMRPALVELWGALKELWTALAPLREPIIELISLVAKIVAGFLLWSAKMNIDTIVALIKLAAIIMEKVAPAITVAADVITFLIGVFTKFVTAIVQVITKIVEFATGVIEHFTRARDSAVSTVGEIVAKITEIATKISDFVTSSLQKWTAFWEQFKLKATEIWGSITSAVSTGFSAVSGTITTVGAAVQATWNTFWAAVRDFVAPIWAAIRGFVQSGINAVKAVIDSVIAAIKAAWEAFWRLFGPPVTAAWDLVKSVVQLGIAAVRDAIVTVTTQIRQAWEAVWNAIKNFVGPIWTSIKTTITTTATAVRDTLAGIWNSIKTTAESVWNSIKTSATTIWTAIKSAIGSAIDGVKGVLQGVWNSIKTTAESVWNSIKSAASSIWNAIKSAIEGPSNATKSSLTSIWNSIKSTAQSVWNAIKSAIEGPINAAKNAVTSAVNAMKSVVTSAWNAVKSATSDTWGKFSSTIKSEVDKAMGVVSKIKDTVVNAVKDAGTWLLKAGSDLVQGFIDGITRKLGELKAKVQEMTDLTKKHTEQQLASHSPSQVFMQFGRDVVQGFIEGIDKLFPDLRNKLQEFTDLVKKIAAEKLKLGSPSKVFFEFGEWSMQGYIDGLEQWMPKVRQIFEELKAHWPEVKRVAEDAANSIKGNLSSIDIEGHVSDIIAKLQPLSKTMQTLNIQDHVKEIADKLAPVADKIKNLDLAGGLQTVADKMQPIVDKIKSIDLATPLQKIAEKMAPAIDSLQGMVGEIKGIDIESTIRNLTQRLAPLAPAIRSSLQSGDLQGIANLANQVAPSLPKITVSPGQVTNTFPDKITLKVGDREFDAYIDGRADALLGQAASLLSRGRK